jgi:hypothetical protein
MKYRIVKFVIFSLFFSCNIFAQKNEVPGSINYSPNIIPSSPTTSELGKYGMVPVSLSTGTPNINIPLFILNIGKLSLPLSLSYNSNGIKVDQIASWVGLGWSLNAGGVVTRTIRGGDDEANQYPIPPEITNFCEKTYNYLNYSWAEKANTEPDLYTFNFNGYTGKFVLQSDSIYVAYLIPYSNLKIEVLDPNLTYEIMGFRITTPDGIKYTFGEEYIETSKVLSIGQECNKQYGNEPMKTSWYLKTIEHPDGSSIAFTYESNQLDYFTGISQTISKISQPLAYCDNNTFDPYQETKCIQSIRLKTFHLRKITSSCNDSVVFFSTKLNRTDFDDPKLDSIKVYNNKGNVIKKANMDYTFSNSTTFSAGNGIDYYINQDLKHRMFLRNVYVNGPDNVNPQKYNFDYIEMNQLPVRLSYAQDYWGYFNGKQNNYLVPNPGPDYPLFDNIGGNREPDSAYSKMGLLNKIIYPTGGITTLYYEPNTFYETKLVYPPLSVFQIDTNGRGLKYPNSISRNINSTTDQTQRFYAWISYDSTEYQYDPLHHIGKVNIYDNTEAKYVYQSIAIDLGMMLAPQIQLYKNHDYTITLTASGEGTTVFFKLNYYAQPPTSQSFNSLCGGVRIKKTVSNNNINNINEITHYYYSTLEEPNKSSGITGYVPTYISSRVITPTCYQIQYERETFTLHSNSVNDNYNINGNNVMYKNVIVSYGDNYENGGEKNQYKITVDIQGYILSWSSNNIVGATKTNCSWNSGLPEYQLIFKKNNEQIIPLKETYYTYKEDSRKEKILFGYTFRKNYDNIYTRPFSFICEKQDTGVISTYCNANHRHHYFFGFFGVRCIAPGNNNSGKNYCECHGHNVGDTIINHDAIDNFDGQQYEIISKWNYVDTLKTYTYDDNGQNPIKETIFYQYNNPEHALINITIRVNSNGDTIKAYSYFPQDYSQNAITNNFQSLVDKHIINVPVDERETINQKLVNGKVTRYNEIGQPTEIYIARTELGSILSFNKDNPYLYGEREAVFQYNDITHKIQSFKPENNIPVTYLWGYHNTYPVAEITGSTYEEVAAKLQEGNYTITTLQESCDSSYILNAAAYLRNNLLSSTIVAYTYESQIGITSKTDAAGIKTFYKYDGFGRLSAIQDNDGKILKKYEYHYANQ